MTLRSGRGGLALAGMSLAAFVFITAETLPIALLPQIASGLAVPQSAVGLLVGIYAFVVLVATLPLTRLTARVPRRPLLLGLLALLVVSVIAGALSTSWALLLVARLATALAHSVFWAVAVPIAAEVVPAERRGRAVSAVYGGQAVAVVVGVPLATIAGQAAGWRAAFLGTGGLGLVALAVVAVALPRVAGAAEGGAAGRGSRPDARAYGVLVAVTVLAVTGTLAAFTYINPFLLEVSRVPEAAIGVLLSVRGAAGLLAVLVVGRLVDRFPRAALAVPLALQAVALAVQGAGGREAWIAATAITVSGAGGAAFSAALGARVLVVAPGRVDVATAGTSTAYNAGIMLGSTLGSAVLVAVGLPVLPLLASAVVLVALVLQIGAPAVLRRP